MNAQDRPRDASAPRPSTWAPSAGLSVRADAPSAEIKARMDALGDRAHKPIPIPHFPPLGM
ncbi:hypothetical protein [Microbacterium sp. 22242]|uniref:hypothetical protein n=1 Tax=Microbacterium sp. 22242 TaxID=3453896 RepID=UPI003F865BFD